jgi:hypothetical protein
VEVTVPASPASDPTDELLAAQRAYYDLRAPDDMIVNEANHDASDVPTAQRTLRDGRSFTIVKVFWDPTELETRLGDIGWTATVRPLGETCLAGNATPA